MPSLHLSLMTDPGTHRNLCWKTMSGLFRLGKRRLRSDLIIVTTSSEGDSGEEGAYLLSLVTSDRTEGNGNEAASGSSDCTLGKD